MLVPPERVLPQDDPGCRDLDLLLPRLRRAGVRTILSADPLAHPDLSLLGRTQPERLAPLAVHSYALARPLPLVHVATRVVPASSAAAGATQAMQPGFLESGGAAVEGAPARQGVRGRVESVRAGSDWMDVAVEASSPTVLVVRDGWAPGWTAEVDGTSAVVARADGRHRAVRGARGTERGDPALPSARRWSRASPPASWASWRWRSSPGGGRASAAPPLPSLPGVGGRARFDCHRVGGYHAEYTRALSEIWPSSESSPRATTQNAFRGNLSRTSTGRPSSSVCTRGRAPRGASTACWWQPTTSASPLPCAASAARRS